MKGVNLTMANAQTVVLTTKHAQDTKVSEIDTSKLLPSCFFYCCGSKSARPAQM